MADIHFKRHYDSSRDYRLDPKSSIDSVLCLRIFGRSSSDERIKGPSEWTLDDVFKIDVRGRDFGQLVTSPFLRMCFYVRVVLETENETENETEEKSDQSEHKREHEHGHSRPNCDTISFSPSQARWAGVDNLPFCFFVDEFGFEMVRSAFSPHIDSVENIGKYYRAIDFMGLEQMSDPNIDVQVLSYMNRLEDFEMSRIASIHIRSRKVDKRKFKCRRFKYAQMREAGIDFDSSGLTHSENAAVVVYGISGVPIWPNARFGDDNGDGNGFKFKEQYEYWRPTSYFPCFAATR